MRIDENSNEKYLLLDFFQNVYFQLSNIFDEKVDADTKIWLIFSRPLKNFSLNPIIQLHSSEHLFIKNLKHFLTA